MFYPSKGDIVWLDFDPSVGKEIMKRRPAFVISGLDFNQRTGFVIVAPITSTITGKNFEVVLPDKLNTKGAVLVHQLRSMDFANRDIKRIEKAPDTLIEQVTKRAKIIIC